MGGSIREGCRSRTLCLTIIVVIGVLIPANAAAAYSETTVNDDIAADEYWHMTLNLAAKDPISISLSVTGGMANFYFLDSEGFVLFNYAWNGTSQFNIFSYYPDLSSKNINSISKSAVVPTTGVYYIVAYCTGWETLHITGKVSAGVKPMDPISLIIPLAIVACIFGIPISAFFLQKRSKRTRQEQAIKSGAMPRCPQCGGFNEEGMFFCATCGFKLKG